MSWSGVLRNHRDSIFSLLTRGGFPAGAVHRPGTPFLRLIEKLRVGWTLSPPPNLEEVPDTHAESGEDIRPVEQRIRTKLPGIAIRAVD